MSSLGRVACQHLASGLCQHPLQFWVPNLVLIYSYLVLIYMLAPDASPWQPGKLGWPPNANTQWELLQDVTAFGRVQNTAQNWHIKNRPTNIFLNAKTLPISIAWVFFTTQFVGWVSFSMLPCFNALTKRKPNFQADEAETNMDMDAQDITRHNDILPVPSLFILFWVWVFAPWTLFLFVYFACPVIC